MRKRKAKREKTLPALLEDATSSLLGISVFLENNECPLRGLAAEVSTMAGRLNTASVSIQQCEKSLTEWNRCL